MMNEYAETHQILPIHVQYITNVSLNYERKSVTSTSPIEKLFKSKFSSMKDILNNILDLAIK